MRLTHSQSTSPRAIRVSPPHLRPRRRRRPAGAHRRRRDRRAARRRRHRAPPRSRCTPAPPSGSPSTEGATPPPRSTSCVRSPPRRSSGARGKVALLPRASGRRCGDELHDALGHALSLASLLAGAARTRLAADPHGTAALLGELAETAGGAAAARGGGELALADAAADPPEGRPSGAARAGDRTAGRVRPRPRAAGGAAAEGRGGRPRHRPRGADERAGARARRPGAGAPDHRAGRRQRAADRRQRAGRQIAPPWLRPGSRRHAPPRAVGRRQLRRRQLPSAAPSASPPACRASELLPRRLEHLLRDEVDHHVVAVLAPLGEAGRREALEHDRASARSAAWTCSTSSSASGCCRV